jgi:methylmalonyl-CoA mutase C-terminal domain/subunit
VTVRVLLAKPGLDGHDRGLKVVAMALRDAGAEVVYLGLRQSPESILEAAIAEDVDVIGLSILSGAHLALTTKLVERRHRLDADDIPIVVGGTIPATDVEELLGMGVAAVFPAGSVLPDVVERTISIGSAR